MSDEEEVVTGEVLPEETGRRSEASRRPGGAGQASRRRASQHYPDGHDRGYVAGRVVPGYIEILTEKIKKDPYPSTGMLERLRRLSSS
jgi:hypothetical protein